MSLGDEEHPIGFSFTPHERGDHVHVDVRAGQPGMRALAGTLVLRRIEWAALCELLGQSDEAERELAVTLKYHPIGTEPVIPITAKVVHLVDEPIEIGPFG